MPLALNPRPMLAVLTLAGSLMSVSLSAGAARATYKKPPPPPLPSPVSHVCAVSADGKRVLFTSNASNLVAGDTNGLTDLFLKDAHTGLVQRVNTSSTGAQTSVQLGICGAMTPDADSVIYTARSLAAGAEGPSEVFVKRLSTGKLTKVSPEPGALAETTGYIAGSGSISDDGGIVVFLSVPTQRVGGGAYNFINNSPARLLVRDMRSAVLTDLAHAANGTLANGDVLIASRPTVSADGSKVAFESTSSNLVGGDVNRAADVFMQDLSSKAVTLLSSNSHGVQAARTYSNIMYSNLTWLTDGVTLALFNVSGSTLGERGLYFKRTDTGELRQIALPLDASFVSISPDGNLVTLSRYGATTTITVLDLRTGLETPVTAPPYTLPGQ